VRRRFQSVSLGAEPTSLLHQGIGEFGHALASRRQIVSVSVHQASAPRCRDDERSLRQSTGPLLAPRHQEHGKTVDWLTAGPIPRIIAGRKRRLGDEPMTKKPKRLTVVDNNLANAAPVEIDTVPHTEVVSDEDLLAEVAVQIRAHVQQVTGMMIEVGALILNRFYGGQAEQFANHSPNKENPLHELLQRPELADLDLTLNTLRGSVRAYLVWRELPEDIRERLPVSTLAALYPAPALLRLEVAQQATAAQRVMCRDRVAALVAEMRGIAGKRRAVLQASRQPTEQIEQPGTPLPRMDDSPDELAPVRAAMARLYGGYMLLVGQLAGATKPSELQTESMAVAIVRMVEDLHAIAAQVGRTEPDRPVPVQEVN
jgi:hypothetical protein